MNENEKKEVFHCEFKNCEYTTNSKKYLLRHSRVHPKDSEYHKCSKCDFKTCVKSRLKRHVNDTHDTQRPLICNVCAKSFKRASVLLQHQLLHQDQPPVHKCNQCDKTFLQKSNLLNHMHHHSNNLKFECKLCCSKYKFIQSLNDHNKKKHSQNSEESRKYCDVCKKLIIGKQSFKRHTLSAIHLRNLKSEEKINVDVIVCQEDDGQLDAGVMKVRTNGEDLGRVVSGSQVNDIDSGEKVLNTSSLTKKVVKESISGGIGGNVQLTGKFADIDFKLSENLTGINQTSQSCKANHPSIPSTPCTSQLAFDSSTAVVSQSSGTTTISNSLYSVDNSQGHIADITCKNKQIKNSSCGPLSNYLDSRDNLSNTNNINELENNSNQIDNNTSHLLTPEKRDLVEDKPITDERIFISAIDNPLIPSLHVPEDVFDT